MVDKFYDNLKEKALKIEIFDKVRNCAKEKNRVISYFEMGELLNNAGKEYGKNIINNYSVKLMNDVGKKYNYRTLYRMRKFYEVFSNEKLTPLVSKLSWSHYIELLSLKDIDEIIYYINIAINYNLNKRELKSRIFNKEYKTDEENDTIGIIICKKNNEYVIDYCSDNRIFSREYELIY